MSDTKDCKTEMNIMRPLNHLDPDTYTTYEKAVETFACDPPKERIEKKVEEIVDERKQESMAYGSSAYTLMPRANTYALGVWALRDSFTGPNIPDVHIYLKDDGSKIIRPLTFRENLIARLEDYFTEKDGCGNKRTKKKQAALL